MKSLFTVLLAAGLMAGTAQAVLITECATLIGNTDKSPFTGPNHTTVQNWALGVMQGAGVVPNGPFNKVDTSNTMVSLTSSDTALVLHWGNGGNGSNAYQVYDVTGCAPGTYELPSPRSNGGGLSWIGRFGGGGGGNGRVPDGGATLLLLGLALCGLAPAKKLLGK